VFSDIVSRLAIDISSLSSFSLDTLTNNIQSVSMLSAVYHSTVRHCHFVGLCRRVTEFLLRL